MENVVQEENRVEAPPVDVGSPLRLKSFETFKAHPWIVGIRQRYARDATLAKYAVGRILDDLDDLNASYVKNNGRAIFTTIEGRVKSEDSFLKKLYDLCCNKSRVEGLTLQTIEKAYSSVKDLCGCRFSCPYFDQVKPSVDRLVRPKLSQLGYATDLSNENPEYQDKDYLESGDRFGYRSYHFFVKVPTVVSIFYDVEMCLCEIQVRSELQHVWAVKSHDLLYKPNTKWDLSDDLVVEDMRQLSNSLRAVDQYLISIRNRTWGDDYAGKFSIQA
jgi:ppGpp synthetase/RelA/SpoT-type nucleotidyltranferase